MPIVKTNRKLIYYAHVPKCGGSAVSWFLRKRFASVAFNDNDFTARPDLSRWSKTSPQHLDAENMARLFPEDFFDACFTIVRHPVARLVSAYYFQMEVEQKISRQVDFSTWLEDIVDALAENPFVYDNHVRAMSDIAPEGAQVFYMEHGLDALIPWFDDLTGNQNGPRAIREVNKRGKTRKSTDGLAKAEPTERDLSLIAEVYASDFERFSYVVDDREPKVPAPKLPQTFVAERDAALEEMARNNTPLKTYARKIRRNLFQRQ